MKASDRARLTSELRQHVTEIADDLRTQMQAAGPVRERAERLHDEEQVGEDFDVWTDLLSRRAAVLWVLKSVYVRVLEDRGLLHPGRLLDHESQLLFERLAPNLGETAFLRWIYRDLASKNRGLPELFERQPAEIAEPADVLSRRLIEFWRYQDPDTGARWSFAEERFEGELMGDLYQDLDPVVKDRFALCQTPDFVREFMLDRTLTPAIETFGAAEVRVLDPACGSGHFLIDALKRLVQETTEAKPEWTRRQVVLNCLNRVVGIDLNDYACALARARLVMTAAELLGAQTLAQVSGIQPRVYWADGLEQVEKGDKLGFYQESFWGTEEKEPPRPSWTRPQVRQALRKILKPQFHAVIANPPYIVERDRARKAYHKEKIPGTKLQRYQSAYKLYSLASPFTERAFQLAVKDGFVGLIVSNNFMKRSFGKPLITDVLSNLDLTLVVDTSQAYIPHHGTPTVMLFGRDRAPEANSKVRAVMGKRGETGTPEDPARGRVWSSILEGFDALGFENEFVSVGDLDRKVLGKHPWSLQGGGAADLATKLKASTTTLLSQFVSEIGRTMHTGLDAAYYIPTSLNRRFPPSSTLPLIRGEDVRDWAINNSQFVVTPYTEKLEPLQERSSDLLFSFLWRNKTALASRRDFGKTLNERNLEWYEWSMFFRQRLQATKAISFPVVATHSHFTFIKNRAVFNSKAPLILLKPDAKEDDHLALLGLLNSSSACFWLKQVCHCKHQNFGFQPEEWMMRYEHDATKLRLLPIPSSIEATIPYARALTDLATERLQFSTLKTLSDKTQWSCTNTLSKALKANRENDRRLLYKMVALQEELDWLCYRLFGIDSESPLLSVDQVESIPPTHLPWLLNLAKSDADVRAKLTDDENASHLLTRWFSRHGWQPTTILPEERSKTYRELVELRLDRIASVPELNLLENATFKRRWQNPDYAKEETTALKTWLADQLEAVSKDRKLPTTIERLSSALQGNARFLAAVEVLTDRRDFNLQQIIAELVQADAVPNHPLHVYKNAGLDKRAAWEKTWEDQRREDAGEEVKPQVPPKYTQADFRKPEYFRLRGKLDVPKERFIAFTEIPNRSPEETLYAWAGLTPIERIRLLLEIDADLEDEGVDLKDRIAVLDSAWRLIPDAQRQAEDEAEETSINRLKAELQSLTSNNGPSPEMLENWRERFPPPKGRAKRKRRKAS